VTDLSAPPPSGFRNLAKRMMPLGTRRRDTVTAALELVRVGRRFHTELSHLGDRGEEVVAAAAGVLRATGVSLPASPYPLWLAGQRSKSRIGEHHFEGQPVPVSMVVVAGDDKESAMTARSRAATARSRAATARSRDRQTWPHVDTATMTGSSGVSAWDEAARAVLQGDDGGFVVFLRPGDRLEPGAALRIADVGWRDPSVDLVYWDDDLGGKGGLPTEPRFRPGWSPEMLLGANYLGHSFAIRRRALRAVGGLRPDRGDDCLWDLLLRCRFDADQVARIPLVLGHVTVRDDEVGDGAVSIVRQHLDALGQPADVERWQGMVRVRWEPTNWPKVTIVIPTRHNRPLMERCLATLASTDYPTFEVLVVDNGGQTEERDAWYRHGPWGLDLGVIWWDEPFNYSAVNNAAARQGDGTVLVFLNDDTEAIDPRWLKEMVSWAVRPEIGVVGMQLLDEGGLIQHGGVVLGMHGLAEHLFQGLAPGSPTLLGPTTWYRNMLAATGACLAITKSAFEHVGGFDERLVLCGSDVALGLDTVGMGLRNICLPFGMVRHLEGATRHNFVPAGDVFASYWRYQRWIFGGDPYFSPSLSLLSSIPRLKPGGEATPRQRLGLVLGRDMEAYRQRDDEAETRRMASICRASSSAVAANHALRADGAGHLDVRTVNWFLPDIDSPFYGGINTALRIADHLARHHGVENRFVLWSSPNEPYIRSAVTAAFPVLGDSPIIFHDTPRRESVDVAPPADVAVATQWVTAYSVTNFTKASRKAYLIQDFEPMFYPAGTLFALAEATYGMGLHGICNTTNLERLYRSRYRGQGMAFTPAVDRAVFHPQGRREHRRGDPVTVFLYSRPGHWRNCWELASVALEETKRRLGDRVRLVTAGSWARPEDLGGGITHLGLLDYRATGDLYRSCDIGIALTVSEHPSYLPLELMACGTTVISFDKQPFSWLLHDEENCLRVALDVDGLVEAIERLVDDEELRGQLAKNALVDIDRDFSSWDVSLAGIYRYLCDPNATPGLGLD
jgi:GT2 family glycosyltransferase/glycosyltransferase involved in cell wall biosynthesis